MYKLYIKQAWQLMKQNRFFSVVYVLGTALAISMVMMMAIVYYIRTADIAPELGRDRMLIVDRASAVKKEGNNQWTDCLSWKTIRECYYPLQTPERVSGFITPENMGYTIGDIYLQLPGRKEKFITDVSATDAAYWTLFHFTFLEGKPYTEEEFQSGLRQLVLSESKAVKLFGKTEVVGQTVRLNGVDYTVSGVVRDVSVANVQVYSEAWFPFTSMPELCQSQETEDIVGSIRVCLLCQSAADFEAVRREIEQNRVRYNTSLVDWEYQIPDRDKASTWRDFILREMDWSTEPAKQVVQYIVVLLIFLLVPAVNLSGLAWTDMVKRIPEIGLRKAFGANRGTLMMQVLTENFVLTFIGGMVGLLVSFGLVFALRNLLLGFGGVSNDVNLSPTMLLNLPVFFCSFAFCLVLNLLSALIPAWQATRVSITKAINDK